MQFSDTVNKLGLIQACERYCQLGDAGISGVTLLLQEFTAHINSYNRSAWHIIFMAYGGWQYDDSNQTDLPAAADALTADKVSYALPSTAITVRAIEIQDSSGIWTKLVPITAEQIREREAMGEFFNDSGMPVYYQMVGQTVRIFPASDYTKAGGFKVFFDRGSVDFDTADTTETPGFASEYHDYISIGASVEWLSINQPQDPTLPRLEARLRERREAMTDFYRKKFQEMFPPRMLVRDAVLDSL